MSLIAWYRMFSRRRRGRCDTRPLCGGIHPKQRRSPAYKAGSRFNSGPPHFIAAFYYGELTADVQ